MVLSELQSSLVLVGLVIGFAFVLPILIEPAKTWHRAALNLTSILLALRYMWWRATETLAPVGLTLDCLLSWSFFAIEALAMVATLSALVMTSRIKSRSEEASENLGWFRQIGSDPKVAILIATYNEDLEVLERTIVGAMTLQYKNKEIYVLDDGRRIWLRKYCSRRGIGYIARATNEGAKAGNINHALEWLEANGRVPDFIAVLDADFVPHRGFLSRTLALFHDPEVGLVQTPQHFFNPDPIQHNLGLARSYPDEQRYFFDYVQASRDAWGIAFCCGTSSVARWSVLKQVGGLPTASITEDFMLTLVLADAGWKTVYLNEAVTEGLAPEGLKEYITQRARWCLGMMQIARSHVGPLGRNSLRLRDRWSVVDSCLYWLTTFSFRLAALVFPLFYWFFNITIVDASVPDVLAYFGTYYLWSLIAANLLAKGMLIPFVQDVTQAVGAIAIFRAAITGLIKPVGHKFVVTAKGGDRSRIVFQWNIMRPFIVLGVLTVIGLALGLIYDRFAYDDAGDGKVVILFWSLYNLFVIALTIVACIELPRQEEHVADKPERATFVTATGESYSVWLSKLTSYSAIIRGIQLPIGTRGALDVSGVGAIPVFVVNGAAAEAILQLVPSEQQSDDLIVRLYAEDKAPGVGRGRPLMVLMGLANRMAGAAQR